MFYTAFYFFILNKEKYTEYINEEHLYFILLNAKFRYSYPIISPNPFRKQFI